MSTPHEFDTGLQDSDLDPRRPRPIETPWGLMALYVIEGDVAELREIGVGTSSVSDIEIVSGLAEGDRIIISDITRFREAERVFLRD